MGLDWGPIPLWITAACAVCMLGITIYVQLRPKRKQQQEEKRAEGSPTLMPRNVGDLFGRQQDVQRINVAFEEKPKCVALTGHGGVGKTALALEYGNLGLGDETYAGVGMIVMEGNSFKVDDLNSIAARLGVTYVENPERYISDVYGAIARRADRWLIIYDNVDDEKAQKRVCAQPHWKQGNVDHLITSRLQNWDRFGKRVELYVLDPGAAVDLLAHESGREADEALRALATEQLERLPLSLKVAGAALAEDEDMTVAAYRKKIEDYREKFDELLKTILPGTDEYDKSVYAAVYESYERLSGSGQAFLRLAAYLNPDDVEPQHIVRGAALAEQHGLGALPAPYDALAREDTAKAAARHLNYAVQIMSISGRSMPTGPMQRRMIPRP